MAKTPTPVAPDDETPKVRTCGTMQVHERLLRSDPSYMAARVASENYFAAFASRGFTQARNGVTLIPVVVHVVYNNAAQNISDAQINSQIDVLNKDFRKLNSDVASVPGAFQPLVGDARIQFKLATTDPQGNPTTGITRTQTASASFIDDDKVKSAATGGADAWDASKYLNLWVCPLGGGLLGYAQFPGGAPATDGVVILHSAFGTTGTAAAPFNLGRSATHEIGHWLNLRHIWGDDGTGCNGSDFVADTPNQAGPNFGKPAFPHVTCSNGPNGDMFMNYMDYVDDAAMFMFTSGQITRMQACLDSDRPTIGSPVIEPTLVVNDVHPTIASVDAGPTLAFSDVHPTVAAVDVHPTIAAVDVQPTLAKNDVHPTITLADVHPTISVVDTIQTISVLDHHPTIAIIDHGVQTIGAGDIDIPGHPGGGGDPSPFILSTPHHSQAWTQSFPQLATQPARQQSSASAKLAKLEQQLQMIAQAQAAGQLPPSDVEACNALFEGYSQIDAALDQLVGA